MRANSFLTVFLSIDLACIIMLPKRRSAALRPMTETVDVDCGDSNEEAELCMEEIDLEGLNVNAAGAGALNDSSSCVFS